MHVLPGRLIISLCMSIKTFGAAEEKLQTCEVVRVSVKFKDGSSME